MPRLLGLSLSFLLFAACVRSEPTLTVMAASSLREVFVRLFEHTPFSVRFQFAGTQELATQLEAGAPADVFASADEKHAQALFEKGLLSKPKTLAFNVPVLVVSKEAAQKIRSLHDLPLAERIVLGVPNVPIGRYAEALLNTYPDDFRQQVYRRVVSRELNVKKVLTRVALGEAEAGFVYRTDVTDTSELKVIELPPGHAIRTQYTVATVTKNPSSPKAEAFVETLLSAEGQAVFQQMGFEPAEP